MSAARPWTGGRSRSDRRGPRGRRWALGVALLLGLATGACIAHRPGPVEGYTGTAPAAAGTSGAWVAGGPWTADGLVPVRLTRASGQLQVIAESDLGDRIELLRSGSRVVDPRGNGQRWRRVPLPTGASGWRFAGRLYAGELLVEAAASGGLETYVLLDLEEYVSGVVAAELVLWSAPPALLEAQAVAARSYAVANLRRRAATGRGYLHDSVLDQAFRGRFEPDQASRARGLDRRLADAIERTRGRVLTVGGEVVDARFHAACGGRTAEPRAVFELPPPSGHASVVCPPCAASRRAVQSARARSLEPPPEHGDLAWSFTASRTELADVVRELGLGERLRAFELGAPTRDDRWSSVRLVGDRGRREIAAGELRRMLGWDRMRSTLVTSTWPRAGATIDGGLRFDGLGHGHGAGLCQRGAGRLAAQGESADRILSRYYPGAQALPLGLTRAGSPGSTR